MHKRIIDIITKDVSNLLRLDEDDLFDLKVTVGLQYLELYFEHDPNIGKMLSTHAKFWLWWCELWAQRDRELLKLCERKAWGIAYRYKLKEVVLKDGNKFTPIQIVPILARDVWSFYTNHHNAARIKFYPNYVLISACMKENKTLTI